MAALKARVGYQNKDGDNRRCLLVNPAYPTQYASATTVTIPKEGYLFEITGTTTIANLLVDGSDVLPGREVVLRGVTGTSASVTDTALGSTAAGKIHLAGSRTLSPGGSLMLEQQANGSWYETGYISSLG